MRADRPARGSHEPGTFWFYNNWDCNALGTIFERRTGVSLGSAFESRIAEAIGMQDFRARDVSYIWGRESDFPAYPFAMTARDMARFGLLYLRGGEWNGRQIIPRPWIEASLTAHSDCAGRGPVAQQAPPGFTLGYGYLWWVFKYRRPDTGAEVSAFGAEGNGGQTIRIYPARDLVIVNVTNFEETGIDSRAKFEALARILLGAQGKPGS
jgi:CubicO group peptidase (beta-lactamase class C family)